MIRLSWRQFRTQALLGVGALAIVALVLLITGPHLASVYNLYLSSCRAASNCGASPTNPVLGSYRFLRTGLPVVVVVVPALTGVFWGAPLVAHELETGTFRLAWTQSVTRQRWLAIKLAVVGVSSIAIAGLLALMASWWANPIYKINQDLFSPLTFSTRGLVPFAYSAFAFALGVCAGMILRKSLPAMVVTLVGFVGARLAVTYWVRPHLWAPAKLSLALSAAGRGLGFQQSSSGLIVTAPTVSIPNAWIYSGTLTDSAGHGLTHHFLTTSCPKVVAVLAPRPGGASPTPVQQDFQNCIAKIAARFHELVTYQPASRYWTFQWYETAIFVGAALVLVGIGFWWVRRRLS